MNHPGFLSGDAQNVPRDKPGTGSGWGISSASSWSSSCGVVGVNSRVSQSGFTLRPAESNSSSRLTRQDVHWRCAARSSRPSTSRPGPPASAPAHPESPPPRRPHRAQNRKSPSAYRCAHAQSNQVYRRGYPALASQGARLRQSSLRPPSPCTSTTTGPSAGPSAW